MAESCFDVSFSDEDECKFYSDSEYEEFLKNIKKNLQFLDSKSDQDCPDACVRISSNTDTEFLCDNKPDSRVKDLSDAAANNGNNNKPGGFFTTSAEYKSDIQNSTGVESSFPDKNLDSQFANFISSLRSVLDKDDENDSHSNSNDSSDDSTENSEEEENNFEKFLAQMNDRLEGSNLKNKVLHHETASLPRSRSLSCEIDSKDQAIHARSQSTSRIPYFNLSKAKAQAAHDFMSKRKFYADQMYKFFNGKIFSNKLPETVLLKWNGKMKSTAGFCKCSRKNDEYSFYIELSPNVLTSFDRLQDTLIHEMCHAACWIINHSRDHHGPLWKTWAERCNIVLPEIKVPTTCHSYELSYAYILKCTKCVFERKRHKMCEKLQRTLCPICKAPTELKKSM